MAETTESSVSSVLLLDTTPTPNASWSSSTSSALFDDDWSDGERNLALEWFSYIVEGVLLSAISVVGCFANVFTVLGLTRKGRTRSFTRHLLALAVFDLLYLVMGMAVFGMPKISSWYANNVYNAVLPICYGLAHVGRVGSCLLTLSVSVERYLSVCHPLKEVGRKQWLLPATIVFAVVYNVPKLFEFEHDDHGNVVSTPMRNNPVYIIVYFFWSKFLLVELIPYILLIWLNFSIWRSVRNLARINRRGDQEQGCVQDEELELAGILIALVSIFIFCQSFKLLPDLYEVLTCSHSRMKIGACQGMVVIEYVIDISHCLLAFNSSVNFFIYVIMGGKFRQIIIQMFRDMGARLQQQPDARHYEMVLVSEKRNNENKKENNNNNNDNGDDMNNPLVNSSEERRQEEETSKKEYELDPQIFRQWPLTMYDMPVIVVQHHADNHSTENFVMPTTTTTLASHASPGLRSKARKHFRFWKQSPSPDASSNFLAVDNEHVVKRAKSQPVCAQKEQSSVIDVDRLDANRVHANPSGVSI